MGDDCSDGGGRKAGARAGCCLGEGEGRDDWPMAPAVCLFFSILRTDDRPLNDFD